MDQIIKSAKKHIADEKRRLSFYKDVIVAFEGADCDVLGECAGQDPIFDQALAKSGYDV